MKKILFLLCSVSVFLAGCGSENSGSSIWDNGGETEIGEVLPVTGTFINLPYQDVRNKYTNPPHIDGTDPQMWAVKVAEMKKMGMQYLVFMSVANEGKSYYPSQLMDWQYPDWRQSPAAAVTGRRSRLR